MKLLKNAKITIGDLDFTCRLTSRAVIEFEQMINPDQDPEGRTIEDFKFTSDLVMLFYCMAKAGARNESRDFGYTYDQFLDAIDDYYHEIVNKFNELVYDLVGDDLKKKIAQAARSG